MEGGQKHYKMINKFHPKKINSKEVIKIKRTIGFVFFVCIAFLLFPITSFAEKVLVIDPGHGGRYPGTCGYSGSVCEKTVNLQVALKLREELKGTDIKVYMTRDSDKHFSTKSSSDDLKKRMEVANNFVKGNNDNSIFLSIHHNASPNSRNARGLETYYYDPINHYKEEYPPDPLQFKYVKDNERFAKLIHNSILNSVKPYYNLKDGKVRNTQSLYVIRNAQMPSVLVELGYMTNPTEEKMIKSAEYQNRAAKGIAEAVKNYFKVFEVYDEKGNKLGTFEKKEDALNFANNQKQPVRVFDKDKQVYINNRYQVYHRTEGYLNEFFNKDEAIKYAQNRNNTRVVDLEYDWSVWSNYVPANYYVYVNDTLKGKYFDYEEALNTAKKHSNSKIVKNSSNEILWSNINGVKPTKPFNINKLAGSYRSTTSTAVSGYLYPSGFDSEKEEKTVILTTGYDFADALSAGPLSLVYGKAPILLTKPEQLDSNVKREITRIKAEKVVVIGGEKAISPQIQKELEMMGLEVERINGAHRYQTNENILNKMGDVNGYFIVSGTSFADALSVAPIAAAKNWGIVLSEKDYIRQTALNKVKGKPALIIGGDAVLSKNVENQVKSVAKSVNRLGGSDRYRTLAKVLWHFEEDLQTNTMIVSTGKNYPDALASAPLAIDTNAPLILLDNTSTIKQELQSFLLEFGYDNNINHVLVVGGTLNDGLISKVSNKVR